MKLCIEVDRPSAYPVRLYQRNKRVFEVKYGEEVTPVFGYTAAARMLGECLLHQAASLGELDASDAND